MSRHILRTFVALATFAVVWMSSGRAMAQTTYRAPLCDPRGATTLAPPPQVQALEISLDIVTNDDDCTESAMDTRFVHPGHPSRQGAESRSQAPLARLDTRVSRYLSAPMRGERLPAPVAIETRLPPGFTDSPERPPRA